MPSVLINRIHCHAELAVSSPAVAETIASTRCIYALRDGQAEWACVAMLNTGTVAPPCNFSSLLTGHSGRF